MEDYTWLRALDKLLTKSIRIATDIHKTNTNTITGELMIAHSLKVMHSVSHPFEKMAAILYSTRMSEQDMFNKCLPSKVIDAVIALTPKDSEDSTDYYIRAKENELARTVLIEALKIKIDDCLNDITGRLDEYRRSYEFMLNLLLLP